MRMMILHHVFPSELSAGDMFKSFTPEFICVRQDFSKDTSAEVGRYRTVKLKSHYIISGSTAAQ